MKNKDFELWKYYGEILQGHREIDISIFLLFITTFSDKDIKNFFKNIDINSLIEKMNNDIRDEIGVSLFSKIGLALFSLNYLREYDEKLMELRDGIELRFIEHFSEVIDYIQDKEVQEKYIDYVTGISGSLYCLLTSQRISFSKHNEIIFRSLSYLQKNISYILTSNKNFKLGSAHGLSGIMFVLTFAYVKGYHVEGQREIIDEIWELLFSRKEVYNEIFYWQYDLVEVTTLSSRASWCVGNLGILNNLLFVAKHFSKKEYNLLCQMIYNLVKSDLIQLQYSDNSICHGYAGYALFLSFLKQDKKISDQFYRERLCRIQTIINSSVIDKKEVCLTVSNFIESGLSIPFVMNTIHNRRESLYSLLGFI